MSTIQKACAQVGLSPKVIAAAITGLVVYLLTKLAISVDPVVEQAINVVAMIVAGVLAPPGIVQTMGRPAGVIAGEGNPVLPDPPPPVKAPGKKPAAKRKSA